MKRTFLVLGGWIVITVANAAGFDCTRAESKTEQLICGNPRLSALDEKLDKVYKNAQSNASAEQRQHLTTAQRSWLRNERNSCQDEACLAKSYEEQIARLAPAPTQSPDGAPFTRTDILANAPAPIGKGFPSVLSSIDDDLVYSHYDDNGNTRSIVQFDFTNGHWINLVSEKPDPTLIAQDSRYIVFSVPHAASFPIELIDRKTDRIIAHKRLAKRVSNAFIQGDRLVLFQGQTTIYGFQQAVAILELPSLKLIRETTLPGYHLIGVRGDRIYTAISANAKNDLIIFDRQFNELGRIQIPPPLEKINANCQPSIEQNENDRAVLIANCGEMHVLDLKSFTVVHSIRRYALFYSMALRDGLIFTTASDQSDNAHKEIVVFDMGTGKEVASLPIQARTIAIKGNILLAADIPVSTGRDASWHMETYRINTDAIRNGEWQQTRVIQQCQEAATRQANTKDFYHAISSCKQAGIEGYTQDASIPTAVLPILRQYGLWLSRTLGKSSKAVSVLEKVQSIKPDSEVLHALTEARLKAKVVSGSAIGKLTEAEQQTDFGQILEDGNQLSKAFTKTIDYGAFSNLFHFSGNRIYIGRYGCRTKDCDGGATIGVFDRNTFEELASIEIAPNDDEQQDGIDSITTDDKHIYASVGYRYEEDGRPNFFVVDRNTLKVTKKVQVKSIGALHFEQGKLITCDCESMRNQACNELNPTSLNLTEAPEKACMYSGNDIKSIVSVDRKVGAGEQPIAVTRDYLVSHDILKNKSDYFLYSRKDERSPSPLHVEDDDLDWPAAIEGNNLLIHHISLGEELLKVVSLPSGAIQTLLDLPQMPLHASPLAVQDQTLYVGHGRDLLIYGLKDHRLKRYIQDFIPNGFKDNGNGLDANRIERLIIDQDRLIALTFYGENSRIIPLNDL